MRRSKLRSCVDFVDFSGVAAGLARFTAGLAPFAAGLDRFTTGRSTVLNSQEPRNGDIYK